MKKVLVTLISIAAVSAMFIGCGNNNLADDVNTNDNKLVAGSVYEAPADNGNFSRTTFIDSNTCRFETVDSNGNWVSGTPRYTMNYNYYQEEKTIDYTVVSSNELDVTSDKMLSAKEMEAEAAKNPNTIISNFFKTLKIDNIWDFAGFIYNMAEGDESAIRKALGLPADATDEEICHAFVNQYLSMFKVKKQGTYSLDSTNLQKTKATHYNKLANYEIGTFVDGNGGKIEINHEEPYGVIYTVMVKGKTYKITAIQKNVLEIVDGDGNTVRINYSEEHKYGTYYVKFNVDGTDYEFYAQEKYFNFVRK